jgi:hypothetical protein
LNVVDDDDDGDDVAAAAVVVVAAFAEIFICIFLLMCSRYGTLVIVSWTLVVDKLPMAFMYWYLVCTIITNSLKKQCFFLSIWFLIFCYHLYLL